MKGPGITITGSAIMCLAWAIGLNEILLRKKGEDNLYAFVINDTPNGIDRFGLQDLFLGLSAEEWEDALTYGDPSPPPKGGGCLGIKAKWTGKIAATGLKLLKPEAFPDHPNMPF